MTSQKDGVLKALMNNNKAVVYLKDLKGTYLMVNNTFIQHFNFDLNSVIGHTDFDLFPKATAKQLQTHDQWVIQNKQAKTFEEAIEMNQTTYITSKSPYYDDHQNLIGICGISVDITKHLHDCHSETTYRTLVSNIQGVVYRCQTTKDWRMMFISDYIEKLSGYPSSDFISNDRRSFASIIHPDDITLVENLVQDGLKRNETYYIQYRIIHKNKSIRWVHEKGKGFISSVNGQVQWLDGVILDITPQITMSQALEIQNKQLKEEIQKRKLSEEGLKTLKNELALTVEKRTLRLNQANRKLQETLKELKISQNQLLENQKMVAIGSLVKGICHELSTPLGASLTTNTFAENTIRTLNSKLTNNTMTKQAFTKYLELLAEAVDSNMTSILKGIAIVDKLRMLSTDQPDAYKTHFNIFSVLSKMIHDYQASFMEKNIDIEITSSSSTMYYSHPELFEQIFNILFSNAIHHGFEHMTCGTIHIHLEVKGDLNLTFSDNGHGMTEEQLEKIFNPFYTTKMGEMSGLDLYALHLIITQKLGGQVVCSSRVHEGTTFHISIKETL